MRREEALALPACNGLRAAASIARRLLRHRAPREHADTVALLRERAVIADGIRRFERPTRTASGERALRFA
jgi:hypothetical protein